jgi:hypothetical protein
MFNLVFDRFVNSRPYPNLAPMIDVGQGYSQLELTYPRIIPLRLFYYFEDHNYPHKIWSINDAFPADSFFPVGLAWFNFECDYFALMSEHVQDLCRAGQLRILFYYHEGDNPHYEKTRLDALCIQHNLPVDCYRFVSGNTEASSIPGFVYFPDHELFYWRCSKKLPVPAIHDRPRTKRFTALSRRHQSWRATVITWLKENGILDNSYWSYNTIGIDEGQYQDNPMHDNPIQTEPFFPGLRESAKYMLAGAPYACDTQTDVEHNSHHLMVDEHYTNSYVNLVLETFFDAEQSDGAFITEKTFKPIRNGQLFVVFGCANTLRTLRQLGYKTFDNVINNDYDSSIVNFGRFEQLTNTVTELNKKDLHKLYHGCYKDLLHNRQLFLSSKANRLSMLEQELNK